MTFNHPNSMKVKRALPNRAVRTKIGIHRSIPPTTRRRITLRVVRLLPLKNNQRLSRSSHQPFPRLRCPWLPPSWRKRWNHLPLFPFQRKSQNQRWWNNRKGKRPPRATRSKSRTIQTLKLAKRFNRFSTHLIQVSKN